MKLELQGTPEEVMRAVEALEAYGEEKEIPSQILFGLTLPLEKCGRNIVNHALKREPDPTFTVTFEHSPDQIVIELRDQGIEFDPTTIAPINDEVADDDEPSGGWGIFLVSKYTNELNYTRENGDNVLQLIKRLAQ